MSSRSKRGFTLIEVLIALSLSVILAGLLFSSLHTYALGAAAGQNHLQARQVSKSVYQFIDDQLRQCVPLVFGAGRKRQILFHGNDDTITYVGHIPRHRSAGGLHRNSLEIEGHPPQQSLVFSYERLEVDETYDVEAFVDANAGTAKTLITHAKSIEFEYFGTQADGDEAAWTSEWSRTDRLPQLVRVRIEHGERDFVDELVVPIYAQAASKRVAMSIGSKRARGMNQLLRERAEQLQHGNPHQEPAAE